MEMNSLIIRKLIGTSSRKMHSAEIMLLVEALTEKFGGFEYYGSSPEELDGIGFTLKGIPASFSALANDGTLTDCYDVQIEGQPPGQYVYTAEVSLPDFLDLISLYFQPASEWP